MTGEADVTRDTWDTLVERELIQVSYVPDAPQVPVSWICGPGKIPAGLTVAGSNVTDIPDAWLPVGCRP